MRRIRIGYPPCEFAGWGVLPWHLSNGSHYLCGRAEEFHHPVSETPTASGCFVRAFAFVYRLCVRVCVGVARRFHFHSAAHERF